MSHVTTDTNLAALEARLASLTQWRTATVANCHRMIEEAQQQIQKTNRQYDQAALELGRQINALKPPEEKSAPAATTRSRKQPEMSFDGLTDEEIEHYKALKARQP